MTDKIYNNDEKRPYFQDKAESIMVEIMKGLEENY